MEGDEEMAKWLIVVAKEIREVVGVIMPVGTCEAVEVCQIWLDSRLHSTESMRRIPIDHSLETNGTSLAIADVLMSLENEKE
jgi:hypothetical protein